MMSVETRQRDAYETYLAAIRRSNAETEKFIAEQRKVIAEAGTLNRERTIGITAVSVMALLGFGALIAKFLGH